MKCQITYESVPSITTVNWTGSMVGWMDGWGAAIVAYCVSNLWQYTQDWIMVSRFCPQVKALFRRQREDIFSEPERVPLKQAGPDVFTTNDAFSAPVLLLGYSNSSR